MKYAWCGFVRSKTDDRLTWKYIEAFRTLREARAWLKEKWHGQDKRISKYQRVI
jgi:hypothetical protein